MHFHKRYFDVTYVFNDINVNACLTIMSTSKRELMFVDASAKMSIALKTFRPINGLVSIFEL